MLYALLRSSVRHWSDTEANWVHIQSRLGLKATAPPVKISSYFCVNISPSGPTVRADVRWLDGDAAVHGFHGLSFSSKQELCYQRASVLFLSCSWRSKRRFCMMAKILKKKVAAVQTRDPAASPQYFQVWMFAVWWTDTFLLWECVAVRQLALKRNGYFLSLLLGNWAKSSPKRN